MPQARMAQQRDSEARLQAHQDVLHQAYEDKTALAEEQRVSLQALLQCGGIMLGVQVVERERESEAAHQAYEAALQQAYDDKVALGGKQQVHLQELLHRIRNDLQRVHILASRSARQTADTESAVGFDVIGRQVLAMAALYDHLLGRGMASRVDLGEYLDHLCANIQAAEGLQARHITLTTEMQSLPLALDAAVALGIVVNELVVNTGKHAFADGVGGAITLRLRLSRTGEDGSGILTVADNGRGLSKASVQSRGLDLVRKLVGQAGCELTHEHGDGTVWRIKLP